MDEPMLKVSPNGNTGKNRRVLIIYRFLPHYRVDFYNNLRTLLAEKNIELNLAYGKSTNQDVLKKDEVDLPWGFAIPNKTIKVGKYELLWQPCLNLIKKHDLIIVEQANLLILNYILMAARKISTQKIAFWGHGINLKSNPGSIRNRFKKLYLKQCDWWFAYTKGVKEIIRKSDFPAEKICVVQNAIDTEQLQRLYNELSDQSYQNLREELNLREGPVGLFCGGMYAEKRLDFLIEALDIIRQKIPAFQMLFLGGGPEAYKVRQAAEARDWVHYIGPKFGEERVPYFKLADVLLMPGLVGLVILDAFAMQTPLITTTYPYHSPEIEYLENHKNGIIVRNDLDIYVSTIVKILNHNEILNDLKDGCRKSATKYTVKEMVHNFASGIEKCLMN